MLPRPACQLRKVPAPFAIRTGCAILTRTTGEVLQVSRDCERFTPLGPPHQLVSKSEIAIQVDRQRSSACQTNIPKSNKSRSGGEPFVAGRGKRSGVADPSSCCLS